MALLDDILSWATANLSDWQRDALRRLFAKQTLETDDYDDLYALLKSAHGLADPQNRHPVPLSADHLPTKIDKALPVVMRGVRNLNDVNRIPSGTSLQFAHAGITVVYGDNASGKSGYARVLKCACRARDAAETVYPDAFDPNALNSVPEATFDLDIGGKPVSVAWRRGEVPPAVLSTVTVFDGRCARAYLDNEQDVAYLPYGLDIVQSLGQHILPELAGRLETEIGSINTDTSPFADLCDGTTVGKIIATLSASTDQRRMTDLAHLTQANADRLVQLNRVLSENDPQSEAKALRLLAQRVNALTARIDAAVNWVGDSVVEKLKTYDSESRTASQAEEVAAAEFRAGELLLPGTGEQVWKSLFEAARLFSTEMAYRQGPFPYVAADARCVLCQQPLDGEAVRRMQRFNEYLKENTAKVAVQKREQCEKEASKLKAVSLSFGTDQVTMEEVSQFDATLRQAVEAFEVAVEGRRHWLVCAAETHAWNAPATLHGDPRTGLRDLAVKLMAQACDLDKSSDEQQKKILEDERAELLARTKLSLRLKPALDLIQRMALKVKLDDCKDDLKTRAVSDKAKEFASKAITVTLKNALSAEFAALGVSHVQVKLVPRVERGKMKHKLVLDLPVAAKMRLDEVLSDEVGWIKRTPKSNKMNRRRCQHERDSSGKVHQRVPPGSGEAGNRREAVDA